MKNMSIVEEIHARSAAESKREATKLHVAADRIFDRAVRGEVDERDLRSSTRLMGRMRTSAAMIAAGDFPPESFGTSVRHG